MYLIENKNNTENKLYLIKMCQNFTLLTLINKPVNLSTHQLKNSLLRRSTVEILLNLKEIQLIIWIHQKCICILN